MKRIIEYTILANKMTIKEIPNDESTSNDLNSKIGKVKKIGLNNLIAILILSTAGQIAWTMENSNFNTFVYDEITKNPAPVAWMVAISAITATLTTIIMGIISDRTKHKMGRRKPYIFYGYIFWGNNNYSISNG
jgi:MFS family permease